MPGTSDRPNAGPTEDPTEQAELAAEAAETPVFANRAERRAAKGKGGGAPQQGFGKGKVVGKGNSGPTQRIWSNRKAG